MSIVRLQTCRPLALSRHAVAAESAADIVRVRVVAKYHDAS